MGKSSRIRADRANREVRSLNAKKTKKEMPSWLMTAITIVLTLAILLSVVGLLLSSNGVFNRWARVLSTKHFKVNANMMSYYFNTQYQEFLNEQNSMMSYLSLDTSKSLKTQQFAPEASEEEGVFYYDELFLGSYEGTWFDYFMDQTVDSVSNLLLYCEAAYERNIKLDDTDKEEIDASLASLGSTATMYGYATVDAYISAMYGEGVKEKDVKKAMEYSALATKAMTALSEEISDNINANDVNAKYFADPKQFDMIDFSYYTFSVSYSDAKHKAGHLEGYDDLDADAKKAKIEETYKAMIAEAKENAKKLTELKNVDDVNKFILAYIAADELHTAWENNNLDGVIGDKAIFDEDTIKTTLSDTIAQEVLAGKTDGSKPSEHTVLKAFLPEDLSDINKKKIDDAYATAFKATLTAKETYVRTESAYAGDDDEFFVWAFTQGTNRATKTITKGDETAEVKTSSTYSISAYFLAKAPYRDTSKTRNVAYMLFTTEAEASAAVQQLMDRGISTLDAFEALAEEVGASAYTHLEDYVKGSLNTDIFDTWLFADDLKIGDFTGAPLMINTSTYCVALYYGEGNESWYVTVKNEILSERFDEVVAKLAETYPVDIKEKALNRVNA